MSDKTFIHILDSSLTRRQPCVEPPIHCRASQQRGARFGRCRRGDHRSLPRRWPGRIDGHLRLLQAIRNGADSSGLGGHQERQARGLTPARHRYQRRSKMAADYGAKVAQIATHVTEADIAEQHIGVGQENGHGSDRHAHAVAHGRAGENRRTGKTDGKLRRRRCVSHRFGRRAYARYRETTGRARCATRSKSALDFTVTIICP